MSAKVLVVIPARYGSTRFPGKALADLEGQPLVVRTVERAVQMKRADQVIVATDDQRILDAVISAGFNAEMTADHATGTDRIGEVASRHLDADIILNLQGDEPLLDHNTADQLVAALLADPSIDIGTLAHAFARSEDWQNPNNVKVLLDRNHKALYFSRAPLPGVFPGRAGEAFQHALRHIGVYAYRRAALDKFLTLDRTPLEQVEGLEQLRALENGMTIKVIRTEQEPVGVDTPEDLENVRKIIQEMN